MEERIESEKCYSKRSGKLPLDRSVISLDLATEHELYSMQPKVKLKNTASVRFFWGNQL